ncbi:LacI family DNA-binding transcriptional regulator [Grimontia hollisae]|uniref:Transcriptional regulator LacI family n=1 Tax=Grimontia hollisae CIP 101886 TaxID=675812 RepID=D0I905_GRIHO|nr:LacI family DNA-binding transcriptional regulator [Grimontia hollisae]AMG29500.1 LacI family DNA-binding transcriptional regulator [Grimontia hollisae]EEY71920.1 transcriptional regulator LacI family [Grimontia hollisae CIP 101886]STO77365.1 Degradation activator [Grimontia hollisae]STQ75740.1 Degradation activator [Grimontia hollisae]
MANEKVTSTDVAKRAGVSQSAVSRVFTPGRSASKKTIEKVRKAAEELGYRPNVLARAMASGKSRVIGLVVAYLNNQFYPDALEKLSTQLQEQGYHVLVFMANNIDSVIDDVIEEILDYQVDGIIAASVELSSELAARCRSVGVPIVLFNRSQQGDDFSCVTSDNFRGGIEAAEFLVAGGHRKISYIAGLDCTSTQRDREIGFRAGLQQAGMTLHSRGEGMFDMDKARDATRRMFSDDPPDALFVANDHMALAVMDTLRFELGLRVPEDVSVVGFDNVSAAAWPAYNLTTLAQRADIMVSETVRILLQQINHENDAPQKVAIGSPLVIRTSARIPRGWKS